MQTIIFILSAVILASEVALMRMFSIAQWHHFAAMIMSIALFGFGLSGTMLAMGRAWLMQRFRWAFGCCLALFVVSLPSCVWGALRIPFSPMLLLWQREQWLFLAGVYALLAVPFTCGALAIGLALSRARESGTNGSIGRVYAANLLGSGLGAVAGLVLCWLPMPVAMSEYKAMPKTMVMAGSEIVSTWHHPLGRVDVVASDVLRVAPGLSLAYDGPMPRQRVMFVDGEGGSAINLVLPDDSSMAFLEWLPSAAPYQARRMTTVLVIGAGGGTEIQQARRLGAVEVTGVELHPVVAGLTGAVVADGRAFVRGSRDRYDLIQICLLDSMSASMTGVGSANESWLYTVDSLEEMIRRLDVDGVLCVTRWLKVPPRDNIKLFLTAVEALERCGVSEPGRHLMYIRGWATGTLLVKRSAFLDDEMDRVRSWADRLVLDVDWFHGATESDVNRRNVMVEPTYFEAARSVLSDESSGYVERYPFDVRPATDDRPYFFHFFRWRTASELVGLMGRQGVPLMEWGYVVLWVTLAQSVVFAGLLVGLPVVWERLGRRSHQAVDRQRRWPVLVYFGCLGLGFMFVEVVMLQKCSLFVGHPLVSATLVIASFLVFAGVGSAQVGRRIVHARWPGWIVAGLVGGYAWVCGPVFEVCGGLDMGWRMAVTVMMLAPLAIGMGMMFPIGLMSVRPADVPWVWAVNGCFSVTGATLAAVLSMDLGFTAVLMCGALLYAVAGLVGRRL